MSIDVFGRKLTTTGNSSGSARGPPGEGFQLTPDGQYNINYKRLINVGDPVNSDDAVSVKSARSIVREEARITNEILETLRNDVENTDLMIHGLQSDFQDFQKNYHIDIDNVQNLALQNVESLQNIDLKVAILEATCANLKGIIKTLEQRSADSMINHILNRLSNVEENLKINTKDTIENIKEISELKSRKGQNNGE